MPKYYSTDDFKDELWKFTKANGNIKQELDELIPMFQEGILKGQSKVRIAVNKNFTNVAIATGFPYEVIKREGYKDIYVFDISELYETPSV